MHRFRDSTLTGTTNSAQSGPGSNSKEGKGHSQRFVITADKVVTDSTRSTPGRP